MTPQKKKTNPIRCIECSKPATKIIQELMVGVCDECAERLLTAALVTKCVNSTIKAKITNK